MSSPTQSDTPQTPAPHPLNFTFHKIPTLGASLNQHSREQNDPTLGADPGLPPGPSPLQLEDPWPNAPLSEIPQAHMPCLEKLLQDFSDIFAAESLLGGFK